MSFEFRAMPLLSYVHHNKARGGPATTNPAICLLAATQYRTTRNYKDPAFLGPRIGDKILMVSAALTNLA